MPHLNLRRISWWVLRVGAVCLLTLLTAYFALPWLLPQSWVAAELSTRLSALMKRSVSIEKVHFGYAEGLVIRGLTVARRHEFGEGQFFTAEEVTIPLSSAKFARPARLLSYLSGFSSKPFDELYVLGPESWVIVDREGRFNIADLNESGEMPLPALTCDVSELSIHFIDLRGFNEAAPEGTGQLIGLPHFVCKFDPQTGRMSWQGPPRSSKIPNAARSDIDFNGNVSVPRLRSDVPLNGGGTVKWANLDLSKIPKALIPFKQVEAIQGLNSGSINVQIAPNMEVSFDLDLNFQTTELHLVDSRKWKLPDDTRLAMRGRWNPNSELFEISKIKFEILDTMFVEGMDEGEAALVFDRFADERMRISLGGRLKSVDALRERFAFISNLGLERVDIDGPCDFTFGFNKSREGESYQLEIDAGQARVDVCEGLLLPEDVEKHLSLALLRDADGGWSVRNFGVNIGHARLNLYGDWPVTPLGEDVTSVLRRWAARGNGKLEIQVDDVGALRDQAPFLRELLPEVKGKGYISSTSHFEHAAEGLVVQGQLNLPEKTQLQIGGHFHKPYGKTLSLRYSARLPFDHFGTLEQVQMECLYGTARLLRVGNGATLRLSSQLPESNWDREKLFHGRLEATGRAAIEINEIEEGITLFPSFISYLEEHLPSGYLLQGGCKFDLQFNGAIINQYPAARLHVAVDATKLNVHLPGSFHKPEEKLCKTAISYTYDCRPPRPYQALSVAADLQGGKAQTFIEWSDKSNHDQTWLNREWIHELQIEDIQQFVSYWPTLSKVLAGNSLRGGGFLSVRAARGLGAEGWSCDIDLTPMQFRIGTEPVLVKSAGVPLNLSFEGRREADPAQPEMSTLIVDHMLGTISSSHLHLRDCTVEIENLDLGERLVALLLDEPVDISWPTISKSQINATADLTLDSSFRSLSPKIRQWADEWDLWGKTNFDLKIKYQNQRWSIEGTADATASHINRAPHFLKEVGIPASFELSLQASSRMHNGVVNYHLELPKGLVRVWDMESELSGEFDLARIEADSKKTWSGRLVSRIEIPDLSQLEKTWRDLAGSNMAGSLKADSELVHTDGKWSMNHTELILQDVCMSMGSADASVNGVVEYDNGNWFTDSLEVQLAQVRSLASGGCSFIDSEQFEKPAELTVRFGEIEWDQLLADSQSAMDALSERVSKIFGYPITTHDIDDALAGHDHSFNIQVDRINWHDTKRQTQHTLDEVVSELEWRSGDFDWRIRGAYRGGLLQAYLGGRPDNYDVQYAISGVFPLPEVQRWLRYSFPGLIPARNIDYIYRRSPAVELLDSDAPYPSATGEMTVYGGMLLGQAAPEWVTRFFPKLNLAEFPFEKMHDWFSIFADGRVQHQAIFQGRYYHLYASGWERPDRSVQYEIGIDLLAGLESKYWTRSGSGRIPLFVTTSKVGVDGKLLEEDVDYVPLQLVKALLWGANPINTAYRALHKRILQEQ